ncbi:MAG: DUF952 domain-containing protein [Myxococcaceae bacterium]|nr:DUF952 domain-containing protein [Myxococcaceae bacterium]
MNVRLFHLCATHAWSAVTTDYRPASLGTEGFIHLSTEQQWRGTAARFFRGCDDLLLLELDAASLAGLVRFEPADGDEFPHLYGPLPRTAVVAVTNVSVDEAGRVTTRAR